MGGLWEAGIKSVKYHLKRALGRSRLTSEEFETEIIQPIVININDNRLSRWQKTTKVIQVVWKKWSTDYLNTLQQRGKWMIEKDNVMCGTMLIVKEDFTPVCNWLLGRVVEVYHGSDGKDELRSIADELKLVVPDNAKVLDLRELIQESEIYKNDKETYQAIVDCVLEEINDRRNEDENRRNENENRLEIEKIKLSHVKNLLCEKLFLWKPHHRLIHFLKRDKESIALNQTVQRSVLNPLADVFGGPGGSNCVVPPQDLLISFRSNKIAVLADVEKAFLQISLAPKDRDVVRFLIDDGKMVCRCTDLIEFFWRERVSVSFGCND
ncbi:integrase catalytic domain-containing protein [Trichonephila clavipes]|nr:integrase catalytic domain-containing protein [Trichonephila clavipes]